MYSMKDELCNMTYDTLKFFVISFPSIIVFLMKMIISI